MDDVDLRQCWFAGHGDTVFSDDETPEVSGAPLEQVVAGKETFACPD